MLEIPGFTSRWYVRTGPDGRPVSYQANPVLLDVALAVSMACAVLANIAIIGRFTERLSPKSSTMAAIIGFCIHDVINIGALVSFGVIHAVDDGFTYSEAYWMTTAATAASLLCTTSLVFDYISTKRFKHSGSGLSHKQTALVTAIMSFLLYLSISALIFSQLHAPSLNFLDSMYFSIITVSLERDLSLLRGGVGRVVRSGGLGVYPHTPMLPYAMQKQCFSNQLTLLQQRSLLRQQFSTVGFGDVTPNVSDKPGGAT